MYTAVCRLRSDAAQRRPSCTTTWLSPHECTRIARSHCVLLEASAAHARPVCTTGPPPHRKRSEDVKPDVKKNGGGRQSSVLRIWDFVWSGRPSTRCLWLCCSSSSSSSRGWPRRRNRATYRSSSFSHGKRSLPTMPRLRAT